MAFSSFFRFRNFLEGSTGAEGGFSAFLGLLISTLAIAFSKGAVDAAAGPFFFFLALVLEAVGTNGSDEEGARPGMEEEEEPKPGMEEDEEEV